MTNLTARVIGDVSLNNYAWIVVKSDLDAQGFSWGLGISPNYPKTGASTAAFIFSAYTYVSPR